MTADWADAIRKVKMWLPRALSFLVYLAALTSWTAGNEFLVDPEDLPFSTDPLPNLKTIIGSGPPDQDFGALNMLPGSSTHDFSRFDVGNSLTYSPDTPSNFISQHESSTYNTDLAFNHELPQTDECRDHPPGHHAELQENGPISTSSLDSHINPRNQPLVKNLGQYPSIDHECVLRQSWDLIRKGKYVDFKTRKGCVAKAMTGNPKFPSGKTKPIALPSKKKKASDLESPHYRGVISNQFENQELMLDVPRVKFQRTHQVGLPQNGISGEAPYQIQISKKHQSNTPGFQVFPEKIIFNEKTFDLKNLLDPVDRNLSQLILNLLISPLNKRLLMDENDFQKNSEILRKFRINLTVIHRAYGEESTTIDRQRRSKTHFTNLMRDLNQEKEKWFLFWKSVLQTDIAIEIIEFVNLRLKNGKVLLSYFFYVAMIDTIVSTPEKQSQLRYEENLFGGAWEAFKKYNIIVENSGTEEGFKCRCMNFKLWNYLKNWIINSGRSKLIENFLFTTGKGYFFRFGIKEMFDLIFKYSVRNISKCISF